MFLRPTSKAFFVIFTKSHVISCHVCPLKNAQLAGKMLGKFQRNSKISGRTRWQLINFCTGSCPQPVATETFFRFRFVISVAELEVEVSSMVSRQSYQNFNDRPLRVCLNNDSFAVNSTQLVSSRQSVVFVITTKSTPELNPQIFLPFFVAASLMKQMDNQ